MLSHGDGIAIIGTCAVIIAAIVKFIPRKISQNIGDFVHKNSIEGLVHKDTCRATVSGINKQFKILTQTLISLEKKIDDLNTYLRELAMKK